MWAGKKESLEEILKSLYVMDNSLRYQIRLGKHDFRVFIKFYKEGHFDQYREIPSEFLDPDETCAKIKTSNTDTLPEEEEESDEEGLTDWRARENLKQKKEFLLKMKNKKSRVTLLQISEFLHSYINGTKVNQYWAFLELSPEETLGGMDPFMES